MGQDRGPEPPTCECHGEPKQWHSDPRRSVGGHWRCVVVKRARERRRYNALDSRAYNALLLKRRRTKALTRRREREADRG